MSKHTPGPWIIDLAPEQSVDYVTNGDDITVAIVYDYFGREQMTANARLIAAAPELLEACQQVDRIFQQHPEDWDEGADEFCMSVLAAAIRKATGGDDAET